MRAKIIAVAAASAVIGYIGLLGCLEINTEAETAVAAQKYYMPNSSYYYTDYEDYLQAMEEREAYFEAEKEVSEVEYLLAKIAMAEAEGEDTEGKALVICVVLNRVASDDFPDTIEEVIYQEDQFSSVTNRWDVEPDDDCYEAVAMVLGGWDESCGALYYESIENEDSWHKDSLTYLFSYGGHCFYK